MMRYDSTPGVAAMAVDRWPGGISSARDPLKFTLVMLVHPNCPCSRASISELAAILGHCPGAATATVIFEHPTGMADDPATTDLWKSASDIRGVRVIRDDGALMAAAFGAETSGQVFLYDAQGSLRFSGGITESRGHVGDNAGRAAVEQLLQGKAPVKTRTPVFGCSLR